MGEGTRWLIGLAVSVAALIIAWFAWQDPKSFSAAAPGSTTQPAAITTPTATDSDLGYWQLQAGNCLAGSNVAHVVNTANNWPESVKSVPCTDPHFAEVFFADSDYWKQDEKFPGSNATNAAGLKVCIAAFNSYIGIPVSNSIYSYNYMDPNAASWAQGDRKIQCVAYYWNSKVSAAVVLHKSIKGARK